MSAELTPEELVSLNRLATLARVFSGTVHDVNNALQIIGGSAEILAGQDDLPELTRRAIVRIQAQTTRAAAAMNEVMQFARATNAPSARLSLREVVAKAVALRSYQVRRAGLSLAFDGETAPPAPVNGNAAQLLQAVLNLIMNAEQALVGTAGGAIRVELTASDERVVLTTTDNGSGVADGIADRVFGAFVSTHPVPDTPGLGLTAARIIAERHGGELSIERQQPGCRATLRLPLARG